jgi:hypothetical protein
MSGNHNKNQQPTSQPSVQQLIDKINEHAKVLEQVQLIINQQQQIVEQYRVSIFNSELQIKLLIKLLEEKGTLVKDEFNQRWPMYLKNDIGVIGPDGRMEGTLKVTMYDGNK